MAFFSPTRKPEGTPLIIDLLEPFVLLDSGHLGEMNGITLVHEAIHKPVTTLHILLPMWTPTLATYIQKQYVQEPTLYRLFPPDLSRRVAVTVLVRSDKGSGSLTCRSR